MPCGLNEKIKKVKCFYIRYPWQPKQHHNSKIGKNLKVVKHFQLDIIQVLNMFKR